MHLEVTFKNIRPKEEIRRRAQALYAKLERFLDMAAEGTLVVAAEHGVTITELTVTTRGQVFQSADEDEDLRTSLDRTFHKIEHALRRAKERRVDRRHRAPVAGEDGFAAGEAEDDEETVEEART